MTTSRMVMLTACALLGGCMTIPVALAPSNVPLRHGDYTVLKATEGRSWGFCFIGIPTTLTQMSDARDEAIAEAGADALVNVAADLTILNFQIFQVFYTTVYADAVKINPPPPPPPAPRPAEPPPPPRPARPAPEGGRR